LLPYHQEKQRTKEEARCEKECIESVHALRWKEETVEKKPCWVDNYKSHPKDLPEIHTLQDVQEISSVFGGDITGGIFLSFFDTPGLFSSFFSNWKCFQKYHRSLCRVTPVEKGVTLSPMHTPPPPISSHSLILESQISKITHTTHVFH
jgi:hypothetical protein